MPNDWKLEGFDEAINDAGAELIRLTDSGCDCPQCQRERLEAASLLNMAVRQRDAYLAELNGASK